MSVDPVDLPLDWDKDDWKFSFIDSRTNYHIYILNTQGRSTRTLGKNLVTSEQRQHYTDKHFLKHQGRVVVDHDYNTIHTTDFRGRPTETPPVHRRFPTIHKDGVPGPALLSTTTTRWQDDTKPETRYRTPLHVLAVTQDPLLPANQWKYSNHGLAKCYPQYDHLKTKRNLYTEWKYGAPNIAHLNAKLKLAA